MTDTDGNVSVLCVVGDVLGVTQLHDVVYIVYFASSTISRFNARTHQRLTDIDVKDLSDPWDIVAYEQTSQVYIDLRRLLVGDNRVISGVYLQGVISW